MKKLFVPLLTLLCTFFASAVAFADVAPIYPSGWLTPEPSPDFWRTPAPTAVPPIYYVILDHLPTLILMVVALIMVSVALWFLLKYRRN